MEKRVFCFWTGDNPMSDTRKRSLENMNKVLEADIELITPDNLSKWEVPEFEIPDAYWDLSLNHRSDYLRWYFMYHYGGGYADIKEYTQSWSGYFDRFDQNEYLMAVGTRENPDGSGVYEFDLRPYAGDFISTGWFIMRDHTILTEMMYIKANCILESFKDEIKKHPPTMFRDGFGRRTPDGTPSEYPIRWGKLGGSILHTSLWDLKRLSTLVDYGSLINHDLPGWNFNQDYL